MKTLSEIQQEQSELLSGIEHPRLGNTLGLFEEVGEVAKEVTEIEMYGQAKKVELGKECADVLFSLLSLCDSYGINLSTEYVAKLEEIKKKVPEWRVKYGRVLDELRKKLD
ncbi:MAG: MazG nucleotide pyrophosphohydrolase domain-containing protein [Candidatus Paceibacterota bacterium]|jgi:NTP pyrophosphatase (non-canonical NTP hydrolase)